MYGKEVPTIRRVSQLFIASTEGLVPRLNGIAVDNEDNLVMVVQGFLADQIVQRIASDGHIIDLAHAGLGSGLAIDPAGRIFVGLQTDRVGRVTPGSATVDLVAGISLIGSDGDGGPALQATFG